MEILSLPFLGFIALVLLIYHWLPPRAQNYWLLLASYTFVIAWDVRFFAVLVITTLINFVLARRLVLDGRPRKGWLWVGLGLNTAALFFFRVGVSGYSDRILGYLSNLSAAPRDFTLEIFLPLGFSFYVLQAISYLVDVYRGQMSACDDLVDFSLYLAYFPKVVAGPIERARTFLPKLAQPRSVDFDLQIRSFTLIVLGLVRKILISGVLSNLLPQDFFAGAGQYAPSDLALGIVVYGFWLYNDFAGYTNIVRGVSGFLGIELSPNFRQPYFARNFTEFWNRWHITLSHWLRDYIFFPLSRAMLKRNLNRRNVFNVVIPPMITMLASGFWHNAGFYMLFWGMMHGLYLAGERFLALWRPPTPADRQPAWRQAVGLLVVFGLVNFAWVAFASGGFTKALTFWSALFNPGGAQTIPALRAALPLSLLLLSLSLDWFQERFEIEAVFSRWPLPVQGALLAGAILAMLFSSYLWGGVADTTFIYQNF